MASRKCITFCDKVSILKESDKGVKIKDVTKRIGIPASTLSTIIKNHKSITDHKSGLDSERKRKL